MSTKKKVLIYAPHTGIAYFSGPEAALASELQKLNYEIHYVNCHRALRPYCITMSAYGLDQRSSETQKDRICRKCEKSASFLVNHYDLKNNHSIKDFITGIDIDEINQILKGITQENFLELNKFGVPIGHKALYEFLLQYKKSDFNFSDSEWQDYKIALEVALKSLFAAVKLIEKIQPDLVICYNTQYSANGVVEEFAKTKGIPTYFIHGGLNISRGLSDLMMALASPPHYYKRIITHWPRIKKLALAPNEVEQVAGHLRELFDASNVFVYSSPTTSNRPNLRKLYGIKPEQQVLVATMSSYDERFAAESNLTMQPAQNSIFKNQIEWIQFTVDYVKNKPDLFLLIRVHPREFPNKRERVKSQHAEELAKILSNLPSNVKVNWPTDQISLYHIAEEASVFLNAWSSTGKEMSALGRPVVLFSEELPFYATDINLVARSTEEYIQLIEESLKTPFDFNRIIEAFRLFHLEFHKATMDLSNIFQKKDLLAKTKFFRKVEGALTKYTTTIGQLKRICRRPANLSNKEEMKLFLENIPKDLVELRQFKKNDPKDEQIAIMKTLTEVLNKLYKQDYAPENPKTSLYTNLKKFLSSHP